MSIQLRPYQERSLQKWLNNPLKRQLLAHPMGAGKTYIALRGLELLDPARALFVVPAIVRPMWVRLLSELGASSRVGVQMHGRNSTALTKRDRAAFELPWRVTSYDLLADSVGEQWDFIVVDEAAALRNPKSRQSKNFSALIKSLPKAAALGLSATYIPNEAWQLWNPLRLFFPSRSLWGNPTSAGDVSWQFKDQYCNMEMRFGHPHYFGVKESAREELKRLIEPFVDRVTHEEFAPYLPPLFVEPLRVDISRERVPKQWLASTDEAAHRGIFVHRRELAAKLAEETGGTLITGEFTPEWRAAAIEQCAKSEESLIVGTIDSLSEGINLSHITAALVFEWTTDMDTMLQFIGRFARTSSTPTRVEVLVGANDEDRLSTLRRRVGDANSILRASRSEQLLGELVKERQLTDDEFRRKTANVLASLKERNSLAGLFTEDEE